MEEAELERFLVETDEKRATVEALRRRSGTDTEAVRSQVKTTRHERYFFMGLAALGVLLTATASVVSGLTHEPLFLTGTGVGFIALGGSLRRLSI